MNKIYIIKYFLKIFNILNELVHIYKNIVQHFCERSLMKQYT
jgi:hypothetical protein